MRRNTGLLVVLLAGLASGATDLSGQPTEAGVIRGSVSVGAQPARRTANRYPGGQASVHEVQTTPVVVYLTGRIAGASTAAPSTPTMTQRDTMFVPSVVAVPVGGSVVFPNGDPFFHNVFSYSSAQRFDLGRYPQGESKQVTFPEPGIVEVFCEVHEFMRGAIVVTENPYTAVVVDGSYRLTGVPPGEYTIVFWHPDHEPLQRRVVVTPNGTTSVDVELTR